MIALSEECFSQTVSYLQEYIDKDYEVRVTCVKDHIFACKINSQSMDETHGRIDWRQGIDEGMEHSMFNLPEFVRDFCISFLHELNINFGCFDFIVTTKDEYVFLECNSNGQWLWIEQETGLPISKCIAETLSKYDSPKLHLNTWQK